jgi:hypothetical protein
MIEDMMKLVVDPLYPKPKCKARKLEKVEPKIIPKKLVKRIIWKKRIKWRIVKSQLAKRKDFEEEQESVSLPRFNTSIKKRFEHQESIIFPPLIEEEFWFHSALKHCPSWSVIPEIEEIFDEPIEDGASLNLPLLTDRNNKDKKKWSKVRKKKLSEPVSPTKGGSSTYWATRNSWYKDSHAKYLPVYGYEDDKNMWELLLDYQTLSSDKPIIDENPDIGKLRSKYILEVTDRTIKVRANKTEPKKKK